MVDSARDLVVSGLGKRYMTPEGEVAVLHDVSLRASAGETVAIVGPSGSGKSTLLNIIGALDQPSDGSVQLGDIAVTSLAGTELANFRATRVGFVFQDHHLLPQLTALENVLLPTLAVKSAGAVNKDRVEAGIALLERMGVRTRADAFPSQMSGGERQRVAIARALINGAGLLLCDEPTGNLDGETGAGIVALFLELAATQGVTVLMVTHNLAHAARFSRVMELRGGTVQTNVQTEAQP